MKPLAVVEEEVYQVRNRSRQDPLNYPIRLNNKIAALMGIIESADHRPTDQTYEVFKELSAELEKQLQQMNATLKTELPRLNAALRREKVDAVDPEAKPKPPAPPGGQLNLNEDCQAGTRNTKDTKAGIRSCCFVSSWQRVSTHARQHGQGPDGGRQLQCERRAIAKKQNTKADEHGRKQQRRPVEVTRRFLDISRVGAAAGRVDDGVGNVAIALAIELEVAAPTGGGDDG